MLSNSDRKKWIKLLWLQKPDHSRTENQILHFHSELQKCNHDFLNFRNYSGDSYQKIYSILIPLVFDANNETQ